MDLDESDEIIRTSLEVYLTSDVPTGTYLKVVGMIVDKSDFGGSRVGLGLGLGGHDCGQERLGAAGEGCWGGGR